MRSSKTLFCTILILFCTNYICFGQGSSAKIKNEDIPESVQTTITKAVNQAVQDDEVIHLSNPTFDSQFDPTSVSLSPRGNEMAWTWQLESINGTATQPSVPSLREAYNREFVDYHRGNITERYVFHRGNIEQQFILQEQPASGNLTIEGTIFSEGEFSKREDHWLWSNEHSSVKLGQLYVYDANGDEIEANYIVECDYAMITIEEEALNNAIYPVTIDPEIGPDDFRISFMGPNGNSGFDAQRPAVSHNSQDNRYLVVWDGDDNSAGLVGGELEIFGQYINADGSLFLSPFRISFMGPESNAQFDAENPDITYNPVTNQHLVIWRGDSTENNDFQIWGQFVDNITQLVGDNFKISETETVVGDNQSQNTNGPVVTYNATDDEFLVVWPGDVGSGEFEIMGQILSSTGGVVTDDFQISEQGPDGNATFDALSPDVIYNSQDNEYLVVWEGDDNVDGLLNDKFEIYGQILSNVGAKVGNDFRISDMGNNNQTDFDAFQPAVGYNSLQNEYIVVWSGDQVSNSDFQIYAQLLNASGTEIGLNDVLITDMRDGGGNGNSGPVLSAESPSVVYSPVENKYLVIWDGDNNGNQVEAFGQVLDPSLKDLAPNDFRISTIDDTGGNIREIRVNALAYNSIDGTFLSVWSGEDTGTNEEFEIFGQLLDISTIKPSGQFRISEGTDINNRFDAQEPAVAYNSVDSNYLVVWSAIDRITGNTDPEEFNIYGQLISDEGIFLGFDTEFARRLSQTGFGNTFFDAVTPDVAYNVSDNNFLVVWSTDIGRNSVFEILGRFVNAQGVPDGDDFQISTMGTNDNSIDFGAFNPSIAHNSTANDFLVVWEGDDDTGSLVDEEFEIFGQIVKPDGTLIFSDDQRYSDMGPDGNADFDAANPDVVYNPTEDEYLVVWDGDDNSSPVVEDEFEIYGQRVNALGLEVGSDFRISNQGFDGNVLFDANRPAAAYNNTDNGYLVVWDGDFNSGNAVAGEFEIFGQLLEADGTEIGSDFRISDNGVDGDVDVDATNPEVSYDVINNNYLATWHSNGTSDIVDIGGIEIYGQFISVSGSDIGENDFRISQMGPEADDNFDGKLPALAYNPLNNNFLIVWEGDDDAITADDEFEIFGELIEAIDDCFDDDIAPVPDVASLPDITGECGFSLSIPTATDNCSGTISATLNSEISASQQGTQTIIWLYDDGNGNTTTQTQLLILIDTTAPDPKQVPLPTITGQCSATVTDPPMAAENCGDYITATTDDPLTYTEQGTFTITWTYDDGNGNTTTQNQTVIVDDTSAPFCPSNGNNLNIREETPNKVKAFVLPDIFAECSVTVDAPIAFDNCAGTVMGTTDDPLTYNTLGSFVITWTFDDGNGNSITELQAVIIEDFTPPTIEADGSVQSTIIVDCNATSFVDPGGIVVFDNCQGVTLETTGTVDITTPGSYTLSYKAVDIAGNESEIITRTVIVPTLSECLACDPGDDMIAPVPDVTSLPTASGECPFTVTAPTATDNCAGSITGTTDDPLTYTGEGTFTIEWTYDDGNGNTSTQNQTVIVDDVTAPIADLASLPNATGECSVTVSTAPTATDNCAGSITATTTDPLTYTEQGTFTIEWTYDDGNGNTRTQNQTVIVDDVTGPIADLASLPNATGECSVTVVAPTATDNCAGSITATTTDPLTYTDQGTFTIEWTYDDGNGNTSTQNQTVIVDDVSAPVISLVGAANVLLECGATTFQDPGATATDNCDEPIVTRTGSIDFSTPGEYVISFKATDMSGNESEEVTRTVIVPTEEQCTDCVQDLIITAALLAIDPHTSLFSADSSIVIDGIITSAEQITLSAPNGVEFMGSAAADFEVESGAQLEVNLDACSDLISSFRKLESEEN